MLRIKRIIDILFSIAGLIFLLPIILIIACFVSISSNGPVIFLQERIGYNQIPFMIWKFRSMNVIDNNIPTNRANENSRVTPFGKIMRRWRLDELPQFWNVLKGDMSIVGPRPERKYFIDKIIQTHPEYLKLLMVKPGLTSLGMIKFGYAENVTEMIERMHYDLEYVKKNSLLVDLKIMLQSIKVIFAGKGK